MSVSQKQQLFDHCDYWQTREFMQLFILRSKILKWGIIHKDNICKKVTFWNVNTNKIQWVPNQSNACNGKWILKCIVLSVTVYNLQMTELQDITLSCFLKFACSFVNSRKTTYQTLKLRIFFLSLYKIKIHHYLAICFERVKGFPILWAILYAVKYMCYMPAP